VAEWFPKKERALATGIFNAGTSIGAMLTPVVVPWINARWDGAGRSLESVHWVSSGSCSGVDL